MKPSFLRASVRALVIVHCLMGGFFIIRWFYGSVVLSYLNYFHLPREERIFTLGANEYQAILSINRSLPPSANILWIPEVSAVVNYYIYPRKIYRYDAARAGADGLIDREFVDSRHIGYVFVDYGKLYPIDTPQ